MTLLKELIDSRIVMIYRGHTPEECLEITKVLMETGLRFFEVTMNSDQALDAIRVLRKNLGQEAHIGAGTVTKVDEVNAAAEAGATYIISPNQNVEVIRRTKELGLLSISGAFTPTEIVAAIEAGADAVKVFPINVVGPEYIKQIRGPLNHIHLVPTGGITLDITEGLFQAGATAIGIGVQLLGKDLVVSRDWEGLKASATRFIRAAGL